MSEAVLEHNILLAYYKGHFVARCVCADIKLPFGRAWSFSCVVIICSKAPVVSANSLSVYLVMHSHSRDSNTLGTWKVLAQCTP